MFGVDARAWEGYHVMASVREENKGREMQAKDMPGNGILQEPEADGAVEEYEEVEIFEVPALFSDGRIEEDEAPEGLYRYDLRGSDHDPGDPVTVENKAAVNHAGTILSAQSAPYPRKRVFNTWRRTELYRENGNGRAVPAVCPGA